MIVDPRAGDAEDDISAPIARSLASIAGSMLGEISTIKVLVAIVSLVLLPLLVLGFAPIVVSAWLGSVSAEVRTATSLSSLLLLALLLGGALFLWRPLLRFVETNFWSLNSVLLLPLYVLFRETFRHIAARGKGSDGTAATWSASRLSACGAGLAVFGIGLAIALLLWPQTRWVGVPLDLIRPSRLLAPALANAGLVGALYVSAASVAWAISDAHAPAIVDFASFAKEAPKRETLRVAHVSDVHTVGEPYGFRIESGRKGPRGNDRLKAALSALEQAHGRNPLRFVLFSGDMTDAGRSSEWAAFLDVLDEFPDLRAVSVLLPGNHDINIIDRVNPARLELPFSVNRRLRQLRMLSAMEAVQGDKAQVLTGMTENPLISLAQKLAPHRDALKRFAAQGGWRGNRLIDTLWADVFPQVIPPASADGVGLIALDSNAQTHFSFTNALGFLSAAQSARLDAIFALHPQARWVVAMHHHLVEYPHMPADFAVKIGTALVNGTWIARQLQPHGDRLVIMHGHRHIDWTGRAGSVRIVSAPSPVMGTADCEPSYFLVQRISANGRSLALHAPMRIDVPPIA
jgi:hypothetical protein